MKSIMNCVLVKEPEIQTYRGNRSYLNLHVNELPEGEKGPVNRWAIAVFRTGTMLQLQQIVSKNIQKLTDGTHYLALRVHAAPHAKKPEGELMQEAPKFRERSGFTGLCLDTFAETDIVETKPETKALVDAAYQYEQKVAEMINAQAVSE